MFPPGGDLEHLQLAEADQVSALQAGFQLLDHLCPRLASQDCDLQQEA